MDRAADGVARPRTAILYSGISCVGHSGYYAAASTILQVDGIGYDFLPSPRDCAKIWKIASKWRRKIPGIL